MEDPKTRGNGSWPSDLWHSFWSSTFVLFFLLHPYLKSPICLPTGTLGWLRRLLLWAHSYMYGAHCRCEFQLNTNLGMEGFDTGIATTSKRFPPPAKRVHHLTRRVAIAHQSWIDYMKHPSNGLTGAVRM